MPEMPVVKYEPFVIVKPAVVKVGSRYPFFPRLILEKPVQVAEQGGLGVV